MLLVLVLVLVFWLFLTTGTFESRATKKKTDDSKKADWYPTKKTKTKISRELTTTTLELGVRKRRRDSWRVGAEFLLFLLFFLMFEKKKRREKEKTEKGGTYLQMSYLSALKKLGVVLSWECEEKTVGATLLYGGIYSMKIHDFASVQRVKNNPMDQLGK